MKYNEAKQEKERRDAEWEAYYVECGRPAFDDYTKCIENAPDNIFNYNVVTRHGTCLMIAAENSEGVYEYPTGLLAWGAEIPKDAYVSDYAVNESNDWTCISRKETYEW